MQRSTRVSPETQVRSPARSFTQALDNFYAPARDRRGEQAIQEGFGTFQRVAGEKLGQLKKDRADDEAAQGIADAIREEAGEELKGVETGSIFRQNSRYYMAGLNEQRGKIAGLKWQTDIMRRYEEWDGKNSDDPNDFRNWMNGEAEALIAQYEGNEDALMGIMPYIQQVTTNTALQHTAYTNDRLAQEDDDLYLEEVGAHLDAFGEGIHSKEDLEVLLKDAADQRYADGDIKANDKLVDSVLEWTKASESLDGLLALHAMDAKGDLKLSVTNKARIQNAIDQLEAENAAKDRRRSASEREARQAEIHEAKDALFVDLEEDPNIDIHAWMHEKGYGGDAEIFTHLVSTRDIVRKANATGKPAAGSTMLKFQSEMAAAVGDINAQHNIIKRYAEHLTAAEVKSQMEILKLKRQGKFYGDDGEDRRDGYLESIKLVEEGDGYDPDKTGEMVLFAEYQYDKLLQKHSAGKDMGDPAVAQEILDKVEEDLNKSILKVFNTDITQKMEQSPVAAGISGLSGEYNDQMDAVTQRLQEQANAAGVQTQLVDALGSMEPTDGALNEENVGAPVVDLTEEAVEPVEAGMLSPVVDAALNSITQFTEREPAEPVAEKPEPVSLTAQELPFGDPDSDVPYDEVRDEFYSAIVSRMTDGIDGRPTIKDASRVFEEDPEFRDSVVALADKYQVDPMALVAVMRFESGFDPKIRNKAGSGATGLIQFMPKTAASLGTTTDALARMTRAQQMKYVERYFDQFGDRVIGADVDDFYMAVLYPKAMGKPDGYALFTNPSKAYAQNSGLDTNGDGRITKFEAASKVRKYFHG